MGDEGKRGLFRSVSRGLARIGGATVKGTAKVAGKTAKVAARGTYGAGKATTEVTYKTGKVAAKVAGKTAKVAAKGTYGAGKVTTKVTYKTGKIATKSGYITMKTGGKTFLFAARKAYPRQPDESKWKYSNRMAKLGFKVSLFTGKIVMAANNSANVQQFGMILAKDAILDKTQELVIDRVRDSLRPNQNP